jgi:hypothetical protein
MPARGDWGAGGWGESAGDREPGHSRQRLTFWMIALSERAWNVRFGVIGAVPASSRKTRDEAAVT